MTSPDDATGELLGQRDLVVIGAGPVGIAALWFARQRGIEAVALEAGPSPLGTVRGFTPGLVTASTPLEWEIDGLPVDCRDPREVTREDLLGYYARVVSYGKLAIALGQRVVSIAPENGEIRVGVLREGRAGYWRAKRVIVTPWYRRRALEIAGAAENGIAVRESLGDAMTLSGQEVVIAGAGLSGLEVADLLIRAGMRVTLLSKAKLAMPPDLATLFTVSGSRVIEGVTRLAASKPRRLAIEHAHGEPRTEVACTVVLNCTGHEVHRELLEALRAASLVTDDELRALVPFRPATLLDKPHLSALATTLPSFSDALWAGRRGVHFAGTLFHVGGVLGAGIGYSIETAKWAVGAAIGTIDAGAPERSVHLPTWFIEQVGNLAFPARGPRWSDALAAIVPVPVPSWSRGTLLFAGENSAGATLGDPSHETRALGLARDETVSELREACYEGLSVAELERALELDRDDLLWALRTLWFGNGLTWVPPRSSDGG